MTLAFLALIEALALAVHLQDVYLVGKPIEQRAGQPLGDEDLCPFVGRRIASHEDGAALIANVTRLFVQPWEGKVNREGGY